jgi:hypothetical protein
MWEQWHLTNVVESKEEHHHTLQSSVLLQPLHVALPPHLTLSKKHFPISNNPHSSNLYLMEINRMRRIANIIWCDVKILFWAWLFCKQLQIAQQFQSYPFVKKMSKKSGVTWRVNVRWQCININTTLNHLLVKQLCIMYMLATWNNLLPYHSKQSE